MKKQVLWVVLTFATTLSGQPFNYVDSIQKINFFNQIESYQEGFTIGQNCLEVSAPIDAPFIELLIATGFSATGLRMDSLAIFYFEKALEIDSSHYIAQRELGKAYYQQGNLAKSAMYFKNLLAIEPLAAGERSWLAKVYVERGMPDSALWLLKTRPDVHANHFKLMLLEARLLTKVNQYQTAVPIFEKLVVRKPSDAGLHLEYVKALFKSGQRERGIEQGLILFQDHPSTELAFLIASSYDILGAQQDALNWYETATDLSIDPNIDQYFSYAASSAEKQGDLPKAIRLYQKAIFYNPDDGYHHFYLGKCYDLQGKRREAEKHYNRFLSSSEADENELFAKYVKDRIVFFRGVRFMTDGKDSL
jgi:tetratricopeptide (TPR) repeat protein